LVFSSIWRTHGSSKFRIAKPFRRLGKASGPFSLAAAMASCEPAFGMHRTDIRHHTDSAAGNVAENAISPGT
jgi:hypothetical protein